MILNVGIFEIRVIIFLVILLVRCFCCGLLFMFVRGSIVIIGCFGFCVGWLCSC